MALAVQWQALAGADPPRSAVLPRSQARAGCLPGQAHLREQGSLASRLHSPPVETTLVAYAREHAQAPQVIVHKAPGAETYGQINSRQHEDDEVKRQTKSRGACKKEHESRGNKKCCANALRKAVRHRVILYNPWTQQLRRQNNAAIDQAIRTYCRCKGRNRQDNSGDQDDNRLVENEPQGGKHHSRGLREFS